MRRDQLAIIFQKYDEDIRRVLLDVLRLEQQYITEGLRTNSAALKEIKEKIDEVIEATCKQ